MKKSIGTIVFFLVAAGVFPLYPLSASPAAVRTGVFIESLDGFDYGGSAFTVTFWVWGFLDSADVAAQYRDGLEFISAQSVQKEVEGSVPSSGGQLLQQKYKAQMQHTWNMRSYPFITDTLYLYLENLNDVSSFTFIPDTAQSGISDQYTNSEWVVDGFSITAPVYRYNTSYGDRRHDNEGNLYSRLVVAVSISKRAAWVTFFKLTASVYLFFLLSLLPFCMKPDTDSRLSIPCATLFAVVSNQNLVDSIVPASTAITLLDSIHSLTQVMIICIIAILIVTNNLQIMRDLACKRRSRFYDRIALVIIPLLYVAANTVLLIASRS